jgi:hypothetical protein
MIGTTTTKTTTTTICNTVPRTHRGYLYLVMAIIIGNNQECRCNVTMGIHSNNNSRLRSGR